MSTQEGHQMKIALITILAGLLTAGSVNATEREALNLKQRDQYTKVALLCFYEYEQVSGLNKICYYNCAGSTAAITIQSYQLCPLNINS
jgi:hypothetical protein